MERIEFDQLNEAILDGCAAIAFKCDSPYIRRVWWARDFENGGRLYIEYRRAKNERG